MRTVDLPGGFTVPVVGQGTWQMGEDPGKAKAETEALLTGIDLGMTVIDTAEMYGKGRTETFLGEALAGCRDEVFLVSKAYPQNASSEGLPAACEASLKRLKTDRLDLYLLHWPGSIPIAETIEAMEKLKADGKVRAWGVSNFDVDLMERMTAEGGTGCTTNQVLYNVANRGPDFDLQPWMKRHAMPLMSYSPVDQGRLPSRGRLKEIADARGVSVYQVALAWTIRDGAFTVPKAASVAHTKENRAAADLELSAQELAAIDADFPQPSQKRRLAML